VAVTQQLARLDQELLQRCREDTDTLLRLVSFELLAEECYFDFCWASTGLIALAKLSGQSYEAQSALTIGVEGLRPVNKLFPLWEVEEYPFELTHEEASRVAMCLSGLNLESLISAIPDEQEAWLRLVGTERPDSAPEYYRAYLKKLLAFYRKAAEANQGVVVWWD
jgi:hypothetical protein